MYRTQQGTNPTNVFLKKAALSMKHHKQNEFGNLSTTSVQRLFLLKEEKREINIYYRHI
jgi:hypothetical protein